jgi:hypothetical protein
MAWRSSGKSNFQLISNMKSNGLIKSERIVTVSENYSTNIVVHYDNDFQAMNAVDRANYVHDSADAYFDSPQFRSPDFT